VLCRWQVATALAALVVPLILVAGAGGARPPTGVKAAGTGSSQWVPGQILVRFQPTLGRSARQALLIEQGATPIRSLSAAVPGLWLVEIAEGQGVPEAVDAFNGAPSVIYAEPNYLHHLLAIPNDPQYGTLWGLGRISMPSAWDIATGSTAITVAVIDSGITPGHQDLAANTVAGHDFVTGDSDPADGGGHGTHVSGTIGAVGNNGVGVTGVNWRVSLMPLRVFDSAGGGDTARLVAAISYACAHGARVANGSLSGPSSQAVLDALAAAGCANTLFVFAAGNGGADGVGDNNDVTPVYPCNYGAPPHNLANIICVAATDQNDNLAGFSNYGSASVDLAAPGVAINSTWPAFDTLFSEGWNPIGAGWDTYAPTGTEWSLTDWWWYQGGTSVTDSYYGNYAPNQNSWLRRIPPAGTINLAGRHGCTLNYWADINIAEQDALEVRGSSDGSNFPTLYASRSGTTDFFESAKHDIGGFEGGPFYPAFRVLANGDAFVGDGAYIDDVSVQCISVAPSGYNPDQGTSMAAPHVSGVAALVLSAHPGFTVAQVKAAVLNGVDLVSSLTGRVATAGRLNACKALGGCGAAPPPPQPPPPPPPLPPPPPPPPPQVRCRVPRVIGLTLGRARVRIRRAHCSVGRISRVRSRRVGRVLRQSPRPGAVRRRGFKVKVVVGRR
jgi:subtilisin family serine protease